MAGSDRTGAPDRRSSNVLVIGANGMLGYAMAAQATASGHAVVGTIRAERWDARFAPPARILSSIDLLNDGVLERALDLAAADVVINCAGVRQADPRAPEAMEAINARLPHALLGMCEDRGCRLIHFSTDSVFDGASGLPDEHTAVSPLGEYAQSKAMGELTGSPLALTIRTSMVGRSPTGARTLVDWVLETGDEAITGYPDAIFSGLTVTEIARFVAERLIGRDPVPSGVLHLAGPPISKFALVRAVRRAWCRDADAVSPGDGPAYDRRLATIREDLLIGYEPPTWARMLDRMRAFYAAAARGNGPAA